MLVKINRWYDGLKEPWRLFGMCIMVWPAIMVLANSSSVPNWLWLISAGWLAFVLFVRVWWVHRRV